VFAAGMCVLFLDCYRRWFTGMECMADPGVDR
jgi:hypothetical protein